MFTKLALLSALFSLVHAAYNDDPFFIVQHGPLVSTRLDSILNPGGVASHQHAIIGSSSFGPTYDYDASQAANCTAANVDIDHSNYWQPEMYRKTADGQFKLMGLSYARTYYIVRRQPNEEMHEFPKGFRMLAGDSSRTTYDENDKSNKAIGYVCLNGPSGPATSSAAFPDKKCTWGLRADVFFPNCWDGVNNWLPGSKHVAYPAEGNFDGGGKCPSTHPKRIPSLFFEFIFNDFQDNEEYVPNSRVLANGDDLGYSLHGDFTNGWPVGFLSSVFAEGSKCYVGDSIENCPVLKPHMQKSGKCPYNGLIVDEEIGKPTPLAALPGNNPIFGRNGPRAPAAGYVEHAVFVRVGDEANKITPTGEGESDSSVPAPAPITASMGGNGTATATGSISVSVASGRASASKSKSIATASGAKPTASSSRSASKAAAAPLSSASARAASHAASVSASSSKLPAPVLIATGSATSSVALTVSHAAKPTKPVETPIRHCKRSKRSL